MGAVGGADGRRVRLRRARRERLSARLEGFASRRQGYGTGIATASRTSSSPQTAAFRVDTLRVRDGELRVEGRWTGTRGLRFLRPTLVVDDRAVLATLEHKPWAPVEDATWTAVFPWKDTDADLSRASLEVAPSVVVPLGPGAPRPRSRRRTDDRDRAPVRPPAEHADLEHLRPRPPAVPAPQDAAPARSASASPAAAAPPAAPTPPFAPESSAAPASPAPASLPSGALGEPTGTSEARADTPGTATDPPDRDAAADGRSAPGGPPLSAGAVHDLRDGIRAAETARDEEARAARAAAAGRDRARSQLEEAVRDRDAAMRTRDRLGEQRDAALAQAEAAERAARERVAAAEQDRDRRVAAAREDRDRRVAALERDRDERVAAAERALRDRTAERDAARAERDRFRDQRDEVLLAHRSLENILDAERAGRDRAGHPRAGEDARGPLGPGPGDRGPGDPGRRDDHGPDDDHRPDDDTAAHEVPLGVRAVPAARAVPADLLRDRQPARAPLGGFDRWALRVLAVTAAVCFLLLLGTLLQLFI